MNNFRITFLSSVLFLAFSLAVMPLQAAQIVTTTGMIGDIVRNVAGDQFNVINLIGEGLDPHQYRPSRQDMVRLQQADIIFHNGLHLEGKMSDVLNRMARRERPVVAVAEEIQRHSNFILLDDDRQLDPHVWMDVQGWAKAVDVVQRTLSEFDTSNASLFRERAEQYKEQLERLDQYARAAIASIPEAQRTLVTAHDAFNYLGRAYGLTVKGIQGISTESEAGVRDIEDLVRFLVEKNIPAVFVETSVADKNIRALVEGTRARGHPVSIGGALFSDAMGRPGTYEGTYIGMIDHNVTIITRALGGTAPERGMQGKLSYAD